MYFLLKTLMSALLIAGISELARRYSFLAAMLASLPLTSVLAFIWLYHDTHDHAKISALSYDILWLIVPSMLFFIALPLLLNHGLRFYPALLGAVAIMLIGYAATVGIKTHFATV